MSSIEWRRFSRSDKIQNDVRPCTSLNISFRGNSTCLRHFKRALYDSAPVSHQMSGRTVIPKYRWVFITMESCLKV
jgi:hypothetical protein